MHVQAGLLPTGSTGNRVARYGYCEQALDWLTAHGALVTRCLHFDGTVLSRVRQKEEGREGKGEGRRKRGEEEGRSAR